MVKFTIGELARLTGLSIQTLRYYDRIGLFQPRSVDPNSRYRYYVADQFFRINTIKYLRYLGLSIAQIKALFTADESQQALFLQRQNQTIDEQIEHLQAIQRLIQGQERQLALKQQLKARLGDVYQRELPTMTYAYLPCQTVVTPADRPDVVLSRLIQQVQASGTVANLQYGCAFRLRPYTDLRAIHYQYLFTELLVPTTAPVGLKLIPAGRYVCTAFRWSRTDYVSRLDALRRAYTALGGLGTPTVYEVSLLDGYDYRTDDEFITELRIRLN